ncbi:Uncharacterised protein [Bordetella pertussis]|nr:Uncharacterised protein [Bordetella pertussis]
MTCAPRAISACARSVCPATARYIKGVSPAGFSALRSVRRLAASTSNTSQALSTTARMMAGWPLS